MNMYDIFPIIWQQLCLSNYVNFMFLCALYDAKKKKKIEPGAGIKEKAIPLGRQQKSICCSKTRQQCILMIEVLTV